MQIVLLGTAAGGGFPQWNCWCPPCRVARTEPARAHPRTQSSIAVSPDGTRWFLVNASPDVREQIGRLPFHQPLPAGAAGVRQLPIQRVVVTDAELDHTLGILLLREARGLTILATHAVAHIMERDSRILPILRAFSTVTVDPLPLYQAVPLNGPGGTPSGLTVEAFAVPGHPPRFASEHETGHTVGLIICDTADGATLAYVPGCGAIDHDLERRLAATDAVLFDGTFWSDDEMPERGISHSTSRAMDHLPIAGPEGSLPMMGRLTARLRVYTHMNNTNPILVEDSPERQAVNAAGVIVGDDGMTFTV